MFLPKPGSMSMKNCMEQKLVVLVPKASSLTVA